MKLKLIHSKPIFIQLVAFSILFSVVPILVLSIFLFHKLESMVVEEQVDYQGQIASQYVKNIEEKLEQYRDSLEFISHNTIILNTLVDAESNPYAKGKIISEEVQKSLLLEKESEIRNCMIYSGMEELPAYGGSVSMMHEASREVWYLKERALSEGGFSYFALDGKEPVISLVNNIEELDVSNLTRRQLGIVKLDVAMRRLFAPANLDGASKASYDVLVYDEKGKIFYSTDEEKNSLLEEFRGQGQAGEEQEGFRMAGAYTARQMGLENYDLEILLLFDNKEILEKKQEMQLMVFPIIVVIIILVVGGVYLYSRSFSARIAALVQKFRRAETGDLTIQDPIQGNDEIAVLDQQFAQMLSKLDQLIQTNYIQQLENKETQLRNLQLQINPHFLYNTLETISSIAAVKQAFVVCDMCQKLGEIFRYSLGKNHGEFVTLEQELAHTKNYIFIQKIRYGDRLETFFNVEVDSANYKILRFILQPIVENAIVHGLGKITGTGTLEISVFTEDDMLLIKIADDGMGMNSQQVEALNEYINSNEKKEDTRKSIGIRNVNQRIRFACGDDYGVAIESQPYQGSCFTLRLPVIRGGEKDEA